MVGRRRRRRIRVQRTSGAGRSPVTELTPRALPQHLDGLGSPAAHIRPVSRLQSVVLTIAALTVAANSFVPPWVTFYPSNPTYIEPIGSYPLIEPPIFENSMQLVRVDYGQLILYHLATLALVVPFFVWRRRSVSTSADDSLSPTEPPPQS